VILNGDYPNAIEYRFAVTAGVQILYNLTDAAIVSRDGATGTVAGNVQGAQPSWFVNEGIGDLHLTAAAGAIGQASYLPEVSTDYDGDPRPPDGPTDVGADEYEGLPGPALPSVLSVLPGGGPTGVATGGVRVGGNPLVLQAGDPGVGTGAAPVAANGRTDGLIPDQRVGTSVDPAPYGPSLLAPGAVYRYRAGRTPLQTLAKEAHPEDTTRTFAPAADGPATS
jgi:hypothetical protein